MLDIYQLQQWWKHETREYTLFSPPLIFHQSAFKQRSNTVNLVCVKFVKQTEVTDIKK